MKAALSTFFCIVLAAMLFLTCVAALERGVFEALRALWPDAWFRATLADTYFAFLTIWLWIAWREGTVARAALWFALVLGLGSMAIAAYVLWRLARWKSGQPVSALLLRS